MSEGAYDAVTPRGDNDLRLLVEASPVAMIAVDAAGRVTLVNPQAERLFGYRSEELVGEPLERLIPERSRHLHRGLRAAYLRAPTTRVMGAGRELFGLRKDGTEVPVEIGLNPIVTGEGRFVLAAIIDTTDRKRAEEHLRLVVEAAPNPMLLVDKAGAISLANAQAQRLFGYERGELIGQPIEKLVPKRYRGAHPGRRSSYLAAPTARSMGAGGDLFGLRKDGVEVPIEIGLNPITTPQGEFVLAAIVDVTERKRSEQRLRAVVEAAPNAMVLIDSAGRVALTNAQAERLFGYRREELFGQSVEKLVPKRFRGIHVGQRDAYLSAPTTRSMGAGRDLYGLRKDGTEVPIEIGLNPLTTADGNFVLAAIIDITERKRAEKLRHHNSEFGQHALGAVDLRQLKQEAAELVARLIDAPFVRIGVLDAARSAVIFMAGVGWPAEYIYDHSVDVSSSTQTAESIRTGRPVVIDQIGVGSPLTPSFESMERGMVSSATFPIRGRDAVLGLLHVGTTAPHTFTQDEVAFLSAIATIIGLAIERDRREQQIARLNSELQHRYDEMESFSYSVAHDLRAPLRSVSGFATALEEDFGETLADEAKRYIGLIEKGATQMSGLIDALLLLSRVSRQEFSPSSFDLSAAADALVFELRTAEPARNVVTTIQPGLMVSGDAALLRLVLQNLIGNAWKFTRDRDPATIAFCGTRAEGVWTLSVKDNGVGFSTIYPEELFMPFKRLHGKSFEGTGIGLATVERIIRRHGGRVWAESEPGVGSTFYFTISEVAP
jgi:PAS domain S-box-containing protein